MTKWDRPFPMYLTTCQTEPANNHSIGTSPHPQTPTPLQSHSCWWRSSPLLNDGICKDSCWALQTLRGRGNVRLVGTLSSCFLLKETAAIFTILTSKQKLTVPGTILQQAFKRCLPMGSTAKCQVLLLHSGEGRPRTALNVQVRIKQASLQPLLFPFLVVIHEYYQVPETVCTSKNVLLSERLASLALAQEHLCWPRYQIPTREGAALFPGCSSVSSADLIACTENNVYLLFFPPIPSSLSMSGPSVH